MCVGVGEWVGGKGWGRVGEGENGFGFWVLGIKFYPQTRAKKDIGMNVPIPLACEDSLLVRCDR